MKHLYTIAILLGSSLFLHSGERPMTRYDLNKRVNDLRNTYSLTNTDTELLHLAVQLRRLHTAKDKLNIENMKQKR